MSYIEKNKNAYNKWAETYDDWNNPHIIMEHNIVLKLVNPKKWEKILDAWCWTWKYTIEFYNLWAIPTWCDFSQEMLNKAKSKNNKINYNIIDLSKVLPYKNEEFDKINCSQVLKHIEDIDITISEFFRILKKWWTLTFSVTHPDRSKEMYRFNKQINFNLSLESDIFHHRFFDYIETINKSWFKINKINQISLNDDVKELIQEDDYNNMKWRPEIIIFNLVK